MTLRWARDYTSRWERWDGITDTGRVVATVEQTDRGRYVATVHHLIVTPSAGVTTSATAQLFAEMTFSANK